MKLAVGPIPLYHQLEQDLKGRIGSGEFAPGQMLPTEEQMGHAYGVSRITVRRALESLDGQGLIQRRRGVGSFVAERSSAFHSVQLSGSLDAFLMTAYGLEPLLVSLEERVAPDEILAEFGLEPGGKLLRLELISRTKEGPTAHSEFFFTPAMSGKLTVDDIVGSEPIVRIVERKLGVRVGRATQIIEAAQAHGTTVKYLDLPEGTPVLGAQRKYYTTAGELVEVARQHYHPGRYRYEVELKANLYSV
ncbi:GntR family transcriptional regulator [Novosphingobium taihuense]|uniref:GntR family transcriptional regulator n=1 Tax=Novosphingobium taihuense TaxID=260085 RepID=A0A7W7EX76_9SPHN|nr:GntR family transcriptional regulator [Novosphingobium taihuense]MBB4615065.1 GntR family transcriptional regulator [Novosphingobium taihuense]